MLSINSLLLPLSVLFLFGVTSCRATASCMVCPRSIVLNLTTDRDLNLEGCSVEDDEICSLILRVDYTNSNDSFALLSGTQQAMLILTNGDAQVNEIVSVWFNEVRVQRMVNIVCFAGTSCGVDTLKDIYKNKILNFDYRGIQSKLADQVYSPSASTQDLTCADLSGTSIPCANGFCRAIFDQNGYLSHGACVAKGPVSNPYGIVITKAAIADFSGDQIIITYTCNKPMCNSKENVQQVRQQLQAAQLVPPPVTTPAPPGGKGLRIEANAFFPFLFVLSIFASFH